MEKLSLCIIAKNEEDVIGRCLQCARKIADEVIVVDTGSNDKTKEIAKSYTEKVYDFKWCEDFSKARNYSFSKATNKYVMWLDADDVITDDNIQRIIELKKSGLTGIDIVMMKYDIAFDESGKSTYSYYRERIINMEKGYKWVSPIHEVIVPSGNIVYLDISIEHRKERENEKGRNLKIFKNMINNNIEFDARQKFYYSRELYFNKMYKEAIDSFEEFFLRKDGWVENYITACRDLALCYEELGMDKKVLESLFRSFEYDMPRAQICCDIGKYFFVHEKYDIAIFWYDMATKCDKMRESSSFINEDAFSYIPYIQMCVCYYRLGNKEMAKKYNEFAGNIKPNDSVVIHNREILSKN